MPCRTSAGTAWSVRRRAQLVVGFERARYCVQLVFDGSHGVFRFGHGVERRCVSLCSCTHEYLLVPEVGDVVVDESAVGLGVEAALDDLLGQGDREVADLTPAVP